MSAIARGVTRFLGLGPREALTTLHALTVFAVVETLIRAISLPRLSRALGCRLSFDPAPPDATRLTLKELPGQARRQVRCTRRVGAVWPFNDGPCLRTALVTAHLLRAHDPAIRIGLLRSDDSTHGHAWVEIDGRPLENVAAFAAFESQPEATPHGGGHPTDNTFSDSP